MLRTKRNKINGVDDDGFIAELAEGISKYFIKKYGEIDPEVIAVENGISFSYGDYGDCFDGMLEFKNGRFHIYINNYGFPKSDRTKFTFAHEIGHFYISEHASALINGQAPAHSSFTGFKSDNIIERQADHFAANLLMPKNLLLRVYRRKRKFEFETILEIKKKFGVSQLAALYRVFILDLHPLLIVKSKNGKVLGYPMRNEGFYFKLNSNEKLPEDSLAYKYFKNNLKSNITKKLWAMDWFDVDNNKEVFEHCIYYDSLNTVYSIIWTE